MNKDVFASTPEVHAMSQKFPKSMDDFYKYFYFYYFFVVVVIMCMLW